jgi:hypothetical protein
VSHACPTCGCPLIQSVECPTCALPTARRVPRLGRAAAALLGLGLVACDGNKDAVALYGVPITTDADGDGYTIDVDCNDDDSTVHPDAVETPGDTIDSNCDGEDDT